MPIFNEQGLNLDTAELGSIKMQTQMDENKLRRILKEVFIEVLQEQKEMLHNTIIETLEDIAMTNAIREGEKTEMVAREEVFELLEGQS